VYVNGDRIARGHHDDREVTSRARLPLAMFFQLRADDLASVRVHLRQARSAAFPRISIWIAVHGLDGHWHGVIADRRSPALCLSQQSASSAPFGGSAASYKCSVIQTWCAISNSRSSRRH
jgi:hypothetical protein